MTPRERYVETVLFGRPGKVPLSPGRPREPTLRAWRQQGCRPRRLPRDRGRAGRLPVGRSTATAGRAS